MEQKLTKYEFVVLLMWPVVASIVSIVCNAEIYVSLLLFLGVPAIYLSSRHPKLIKKSLFFSFIFAIPAVFLIDYVMQFTHAWAIERMEVPPVWILQHISLLYTIWLFLYTYLIIIYYEVF